MTAVHHKTPCNECPWRRVHMPGWLGGFDVDQFIGQVQYDGPPLPCHKTIPEGGGEARAMCAGALIFMRNSCKSAKHPDYETPDGLATELVEPDPVNVFQWPQEFRDHHAQDLGAWARSRMECKS
jgi:hypothetical protein